MTPTASLSPAMRKAAIKALVRSCQMGPRAAATYIDTRDRTVVPDGFGGYAELIADAYRHGDEPRYRETLARAIAWVGGGYPIDLDNHGRWGILFQDHHDGLTVTVEGRADNFSTVTAFSTVRDADRTIVEIDTGLPSGCTDVLRIADRLVAIAHSMATHADGSTCTAGSRFHVHITDGPDGRKVATSPGATSTQATETRRCDICLQTIKWSEFDGQVGRPEWVHTRTGSPECKDEHGRLIGGFATP